MLIGDGELSAGRATGIEEGANVGGILIDGVSSIDFEAGELKEAVGSFGVAETERVTPHQPSADATSAGEVADRLQGCDNLTIDRPLDPESTARKRAAKLRLQLCRLSGEDPSSVKKSRHLGEAEILAVIEEGHPGAYIVTGDTGAARAALLGTARPVHPFAFLAGVTPTTNELTKVWKEICSWRQCSTPAVAATCRTHLICQTSPPDPYRRCVISSTAPYADAATMTFTMDKKIDQLIRSL